jgi:hypothetical protein
MKVVDIEDVHFHQCVKAHRFEEEREIVFIPPDGQLELMRYRMSKPVGRRLLFLFSLLFIIVFLF